MQPDVTLSESIVDQIVHGKHDAAAALVDSAKSQLPADQARRLAALVRVDKDKPPKASQKSLTQTGVLTRKAGTWLAYFYWLGVELIDIERWLEAEIALDEVIAVSKAKDELFFLDDARLRRALYLKYLGRKREMGRWLGDEPASPDELNALLVPCPDEALKLWPVSRQKVGNVRNKERECAEPDNEALAPGG